MKLELNEKEYFEEIKRIEDKSEKFLVYFILFWGAILFLFLRDNSSLSEKFMTKFPDILDLSTGVNVVGYIFLLILIIYIATTCLYFFKIIIQNTLISRKNIDNLLKEKSKDFKEGIKYGYISSITLIGFLAYILYIQNDNLIKLINIFLKFAGYYIVSLHFILFPLRNVLKFIFEIEKKWIKPTIIFLIDLVIIIPTGILSILVLYGIKITFLPEIIIIGFVYSVLITIMISVFRFGTNIFDKEVYINFFKDMKSYLTKIGEIIKKLVTYRNTIILISLIILIVIFQIFRKYYFK
jgi:hypothetical protein